MRPKLGESLTTVQKYVPLVEATTPSLDALKAYSLAIKALDEGKDANEVVQNGRRAIELDPNFALAYDVVGTLYSVNLQEPGLAAEALQKALDLRGNVSEGER